MATTTPSPTNAAQQVDPNTGMYPTTTSALPKAQAVGTIPGVTTQTTDPAADLRGQTLSVAPTADRFGIAQQQLANWNSTTDPQFQADLRSADSQAAAKGQLGSGQLRTSLGDLTYNRDVQRQGQQNSFLTNALTGSIGDAYNNLAQANQQQQYQTGLQNQTFNQGQSAQQLADTEYNNQFSQGLATNQQNASLQNQNFNQGLASSQLNNATQAQQFGQGVTSASLSDQLTNSAFGRSLQQLLAGSTGDPSSTELALSQLFGGQASQGFNNVAGQLSTANQQQGSQQLLQQLLQSLGGGSSGGSTIPPVSGGNSTGVTLPTSLSGILSQGISNPTLVNY